jgi:hypothetical protein
VRVLGKGLEVAIKKGNDLTGNDEGGMVLGNFDNESDLPDGGCMGFGDG